MAFLRHGSILHKHKTALVQHLLHLQATITYQTYHSRKSLCTLSHYRQLTHMNIAEAVDVMFEY